MPKENEIYTVSNNKGNSLSARFVEDNGSSHVEVTYVFPLGTQIGRYQGGIQVSTSAVLTDPNSLLEDRKGNRYFIDYLSIHKELGPQLKEKIPLEWRNHFGSWFDRRE